MTGTSGHIQSPTHVSYALPGGEGRRSPGPESGSGSGGGSLKTGAARPGILDSGRVWKRARSFVAATLTAGALLSLCPGVDPANAQPRRAIRSYVVSEFLIDYALDHPEHPPIGELRDLEVMLLLGRAGYRAPRPGELGSSVTLGLPRDRDNRYQASAFPAIGRAIVGALNRRGIDAVLVTFPDIEEGTGRDLRPSRESSLRIKIWTGRVASVATVASGARFGDLTPERRTNHLAHAWLLERSPLQAGGDADLIRSRELDDFAIRASRHPGRHVEAKLSPGDLPGTSRVEYRVAENRPWFAYVQVSDTGTDQTTRWRERLGFVHNQLTGRDDVLRLDYLTGAFNQVHGLWGSYDFPLLVGRFEDRLRGQLAGSWSEYDASDVGISFGGFEGDHWDARSRILFNIFQHRDLFIDLFAGLRWQHESVDNELAGTRADEDFFVPQFGILAQRQTVTSSLHVNLDVEVNLDGVSSTGVNSSTRLGRVDPDTDFTVMHWDSSLSVFLEPLLNRVAWEDPNTPSSSTLAHEIALRFGGQAAFGNRLVPQFQQVVGGLHSVRGYAQSILAGDTALLGSMEYRLHVPRLFYPKSRPLLVPLLGEFRDRPPYVYGSPDWDLILRAFFDVASVRPSRGSAFAETARSIKSVGGGVELQLLRNLNARFDIGVALDDVPRLARRGSIEPHVSITVVY